MTQKEWKMLASLLHYHLFSWSSSHPLITWSRCPDELLSSVPRWVHSLVRHHWHITKQFMLFSPLTCSVTFPSRAHPASSMIGVIKKVEITWKLISFGYAKELSKNIYGGTRLRWMCLCMALMWLGAVADWRRALNCYVIQTDVEMLYLRLCFMFLMQACVLYFHATSWFRWEYGNISHE